MIVYRKHLLRIAEYWDGEEPQREKADLVRYFQQSQPRSGMICREFYTILIDLTRDPDQLLGDIKRNTRYEVRRAQARDRLTYQCLTGKDGKALRQFCDYYDTFAIEKAQPKLNREWLSLLAQAGALVLSQVNDANGETLVWHVYHCSRERATLFYSASLFRKFDSSVVRNKIGRANRYHHWQDMQWFKLDGIATYDLGGWYQGTSDLQRLSINRFKEEFGGQIVKNYICERALTLKAKIFLRVRRQLLGDAI